MSALIRHVAGAIGRASVPHAEAARALVSGAGVPMLERLAARLGGAQHTPHPRAERRLIVVAAGDHGCGDPGIVMGADHPTVIAARAIAAGTAALSQVARAARTSVILIDAGAREPTHMPHAAIALGRGPSRDISRGEPAMTVVDAIFALEAGIALSVSLGEPQVPETLAIGEPRYTSEHDVSDPRLGDTRGMLAAVALGAIGVGAEVASAALLGAAIGAMPSGLRDEVAEAAGRRGAAMARASGLELLAAFGGSETAVLAGLILGAASINVPVIVDGFATGAAALIAVALAPNVRDYLIAAHRGSFTQPAILEHLQLQPIFDVGLGHGEGTGAAMVLPLLDQVASLASGR